MVREEICYSIAMRYLGIDYGTKRVGLALSDEAGKLAFPHTVVPNNAALLDAIKTLVSEKDVATIVIGHSLNRAGEPNAVHAAVETLVQEMTLELGLPIHLEPEQYTTQAAVRIQGKNDQTDAAAAALILDSYLIKHK